MFKDKEHMFMAIIAGKKLHKKGTPDYSYVMMLNNDIVDNFGKPVDMEGVDPSEWELFVEERNIPLKRAFEEGAIIESNGVRYAGWLLNPDPTFAENKDYRIKGGISLEAWDKYKNEIKHWWDGGEIECRNTNSDNPEWEPCSGPTWRVDDGYEYRIKQ